MRSAHYVARRPSRLKFVGALARTSAPAARTLGPLPRARAQRRSILRGVSPLLVLTLLCALLLAALAGVYTMATRRRASASSAPAFPERWPRVDILVPVFNERLTILG